MGFSEFFQEIWKFVQLILSLLVLEKKVVFDFKIDLLPSFCSGFLADVSHLIDLDALRWPLFVKLELPHHLELTTPLKIWAMAMAYLATTMSDSLQSRTISNSFYYLRFTLAKQPVLTLTWKELLWKLSIIVRLIAFKKLILLFEFRLLTVIG
jgi:hypothetical protein